MLSFLSSQCASALKYLHKHHIIYRDLKSENILVWSFPQPHTPEQGTHEVLIKLADYGISRTAALAGMKGLGGTPGFMAPEIEKYVGKECYTDKVIHIVCCRIFKGKNIFARLGRHSNGT